MKKILLNISIIGLLACSLQTKAMQNLPFQHKWIAPACAGASAVGGICSALYFRRQNKKLKTPTAPKKPEDLVENAALKAVTNNVTNLAQIKHLGMNYNANTCDFIQMNGYFGKLTFNIQDEQEQEKMRVIIRNSLVDDTYDPFMNESFNATKEQRQQMKQISVVHQIEKDWAIEIADFTDDRLHEQRQKKEKLEKEEQAIRDGYRKAQENYRQQQTSYEQQSKRHKAQRARNRLGFGFSLGFATAGAAALIYISRK